ncbi:hypothetical protein [uncultured Fibrella sp.]|uniref:hypothetical protein n=1 Tax=uncultured Fibrella sp. TaxID=1284596 RepID=UPI0035C99B70
MVKLGIICEGESESVIFSTPNFREWLFRLNIEFVGFAITGSKTQYKENLLPVHRRVLIDLGAERIIALLDMDNDSCITFTKQSIPQFDDQVIVVAVKEFENWYLADSQALSSFVGKNTFIEKPEEELEADRLIISLYGQRFSKSKIKLANSMKRCGFTIERAAGHPNCPSARYFLNKLQTLASAN